MIRNGEKYHGQPLTDERKAEALRVLVETGSTLKVRERLRMHPNTIARIRDEALRDGIITRNPLIPGFRLTKVVTQKDEEGVTQREWITQKDGDEREPFELPAGHVIKGISALVDNDGTVLQQWIKTREGAEIDVVDALKSAFKEYEGMAGAVPVPTWGLDDLLTVYNVTDHHLGLFAWGKETGQDYDLKIGERVLTEAMAELVGVTPQSKTAIILGLGDFFHGDDSRNMTPQSGNLLDIDSRYPKILQIGIKLYINVIKMALSKHETVYVRNLPGNHDPHAAIALNVALAAFFHDEPRVIVDLDPSKFFWFQWGKVFIGATHGDAVKPTEMPGVMASYRPKIWGNTVYRYAYFGHVHHKSIGGGEFSGVQWETFQTLAAKDAYHQQRGYSSGRSMVAITHHKEKGERTRSTVVATMAGE